MASHHGEYLEDNKKVTNRKNESGVHVFVHFHPNIFIKFLNIYIV